MSKQQQTEEKPVIVQFFHPGRECPVGRRTEGAVVSVSWNGGGCNSKSKSNRNGRAPKCRIICGGHTRRLISHVGKYVDANGKLQTGKLAFWGEWEARTTAEAMPAVKGKEGVFAHWVHTVESPLENPRWKGTNTDPCVFGSTFKYCCCQQHKKGEKKRGVMRKLVPGSLVLFGSTISDKFYLDTVFVVGASGTSYEAGGNYSELTVSEEYLELTLRRLKKKESDTFYRGVPFRQANKMYSFVPTKLFKKGDHRCGERFVLDMEKVNESLSQSKNAFAVKLKQKQGLKSINADPSVVLAVWSTIVKLVRAAGFVPGVHYDWPR